jgi:hypothetical protein
MSVPINRDYVSYFYQLWANIGVLCYSIHLAWNNPVNILKTINHFIRWQGVTAGVTQFRALKWSFALICIMGLYLPVIIVTHTVFFRADLSHIFQI